jgi:membrane protein YdbS with pleckstrin-like domain
MALVKCPECGNQVSTAARACPACGFPVAEKMVAAESSAPAEAPGALLAEVRPSWWRFFWYLVFCWLIVPWLVAWWRRASVVLRVYPGRITIERGIISKSYREFMARDIRSIDIDQTLLARMVSIGDLTISTAATVDAAERVEGVPDPAAIRDMILAERKGQ